MLAAAVRDAGADVVAAPMTGDDVGDVPRRAAPARRRRRPDHHHRRGQRGRLRGGQGLAAATEVEFVKVAMQPGMPQGAGQSRSAPGGTPIITLPGNPVSALVSFEVFIRAPLRAAMGLPTRTARGAGHAHREADLAARQAPVPPRACSTPTRAPSPATARRRRIICAGWRRRTACWRSPRTSSRSTPDRPCGCGTWLASPGRYRRIEPHGQTRAPPPTPDPSFPIWWISSVPPSPRCTRPACRSSGAASALAAAAAGNRWLRTAGLTAAGACAAFFRHPPRVPPTPARVWWWRPADGQVT